MYNFCTGTKNCCEDMQTFSNYPFPLRVPQSTLMLKMSVKNILHVFSSICQNMHETINYIMVEHSRL